MSRTEALQILISPALAGQTLAAVLRAQLSNQSWSAIRKLIAARRAKIEGELVLDPARRVKEGQTVELLDRSAPVPRQPEQVVLRYVDVHVVVAEKPSGMNTVRHPAERAWTARRRALSPTLEDVVTRLLAERVGRSLRERRTRLAERASHSARRLRIVHRLDKETSGLLVFARTAEAERSLGRQFRAHTVIRRYLAVVPGAVSAQRIESFLVRDRGDGRRGSAPAPAVGKHAVTHIDVVERLPGYTLLSCRLETGRTHQIRIHLAELGHPVCGDKVYRHGRDGTMLEDKSKAPRLALHAVELGFVHPVTEEELHWEMPLPPDLAAFLEGLRGSARK